MRLRQLKLDFDPEQDRLLMRVSTANAEEALLWLTRRCVLKLWPLLLSFAESKPEIAAHADPLARRTMFEFEHEKALSQANFSEAYEQSERAHPLGDAPLLVVRLHRSTSEDGKMLLGLLPAQGQGVRLALDPPLLHGLMKLLQQGVQTAEWGFSLALPTSQPPTSAGGTPTLN